VTEYLREFEKILQVPVLGIFSKISPSTLGNPRQAIWGCLALPSPLGNPRQGTARYLGLGRARRLVVHAHLWRLIVDCSTATRQQMKDNMAHPDWQNGTCSDESSQHALAFALHRQQPSYFLITVVCGNTARHSKVANLQLTC